MPHSQKAEELVENQACFIFTTHPVHKYLPIFGGASEGRKATCGCRTAPEVLSRKKEEKKTPKKKKIEKQ